MLEVYTVQTRPNSGTARFAASMRKVGLSFTVLGEGNDYIGHCWRFKQYVAALKRSNADTVLLCDSYDVVFQESATQILAKFREIDQPVLFSYQDCSQPEHYLALNAGLIIADRQSFLDTFTDGWLDAFFPDHFNDEFQIQAMLSWNPKLVALDCERQIFHTHNALSPKLVRVQGKLVNAITGLAPSIIHGTDEFMESTAAFLSE